MNVFDILGVMEFGGAIFALMIMFMLLIFCFNLQRKAMRSNPERRAKLGFWGILFYVWNFSSIAVLIIRTCTPFFAGIGSLMGNISNDIAPVLSDNVVLLAIGNLLRSISGIWNQNQLLHDIGELLLFIIQNILHFLSEIAQFFLPIKTIEQTVVQAPFSLLLTAVMLFGFELVTKPALRESLEKKFLISLYPPKWTVVKNIHKYIKNAQNPIIKLIRRGKKVIQWINKLGDIPTTWLDRCFDNLYEYDHVLRRHFLKEKYKWYRYVIPFLIFSILVFGAFGVYTFNGKDDQIYYNLMILPLLAASEVWFACALDTREEFDFFRRQDVKNEAKMLADLQKTSKDIIKQMGKQSIVVETFFEDALEFDDQIQEAIPPKKQTPDEALVYQYIRSGQQNEIEVDPSLQGAAIILLQEKQGVVFATRFYQDIDYCFFLPMIRTLNGGGNCLILSGNQINSGVETVMRHWIQEGCEHTIGSSKIWRVGRIGDISSEYEIGIMTAEDLGNPMLLLEHEDFLKEVGIALIINASALLHKQMLGIVNLRRYLAKRCSFAICNDNAEGLEDIYSNLLHINIKTVYPTTRSAAWTRILMVNRNEISGMHPLECNQIRIAEIALCGECQKVRWYGSQEMPIKDMESRYDIRKGVDEFSSALEQDEKLVFGVNDMICPREQCACIIVEDSIRNPAELSHQFASRGRNGALIIIVSSQYELLEYIRTHLKEFYKNVHEIVQWFPAYCATKRNAVFELLWIMETSVLDEDTMKEICISLGQPEMINELGLEEKRKDPAQTEHQLKQYIADYMGLDLKDIQDVVSSGPHGYSVHWSNTGHSNIHMHKNPCYYVGVDPHQWILLPQYSRNQLYQRYLPGQSIVLEGNGYDVDKISEADGRLLLYASKNGSNSLMGREYQQIRRVKIHRKKSTDAEIYRVHEIKLEVATADLKVNTEGYWVGTNGKWEKEIPLGREQQDKIKRVYYQKAYMKLSVEQEHQAMFTPLVKLMNELFKTIYAEYRDQLLLCNLEQEDSTAGIIQVKNMVHAEEFEVGINTSEVYIIEDSDEDIGLLLSIRRNLERFLYIMYEYLKWKEGEGERELYEK